MEGLLFYATLGAALGSGLVAGIFFAFSNFVMQALGRLRPAEGLAAMQAINVTVINPLFLGVFVGLGPVCLLLGGWAVMHWEAPEAAYLLAGSAIYLAGSLAETITMHIPRNDALARVEASDPEATALWARYLREWTAWNHVRTVASLLAAAAFTLALVA